jgi:GTP-binding protein SAR1
LLENPDLMNVPFVIFGNKIDKKGALTEEELRDNLALYRQSTYGKVIGQKNPGTRPVEIFMCSVIKRVGYTDGFEWLSSFLE